MLTVSDNHIVLGGGSGSGGGGGDVVGPASSTDNAIARFNGTTGTAVQDSSMTISDTGNVGINGSPLSQNKLLINSSSTGYTEEFRILNSTDPLAGATRLTIQNQRGAIQLNQYGSGVTASLQDGAGIFGSGTGNFILGTVSTESTANVCLFTNNGYNTPDFRLKQDGNIGIGRHLTSAGITARLTIKGSGSTSATSSLRVLNYSDTVLLEVDNSGLCTMSSAKVTGQFLDNTGSAGTDGQILKKVGGLVVWSNP